MLFKKIIYTIYYSALKIHAFYWVIILFNFTNTMLFTTYFLYLTVELGLSFAQAALLELPVFISQFLFELPSVFFADRYGLKKSIIISLILLALAPLNYLLTNNYFVLFLNGIIYGAGYAFYSGAFDALAVETFKENTKQYFTVRQMLNNLMNIIVPVITIALATLIGYKIFYLFDFIFKIIILIIILLFIRDIKIDQQEVLGGIQFLKAGLKSIKAQLKMSKALLYQAYSQFFWGVSSFAVDVFFIKSIAISAGENNVGIVFAAASIVAVLGNYLAYKIKTKKSQHRAFWITFLISSVFVLLVAPTLGSSAMVIMILGRSFFLNTHEVLSSIIVNEIIEYDRASILSFFSFLTTTGKILMTLLIGGIADSLGLSVIRAIAGLVLLFVSYCLFMVQKNILI